jgi:hypothetical protein
MMQSSTQQQHQQHHQQQLNHRGAGYGSHWKIVPTTQFHYEDSTPSHVTAKGNGDTDDCSHGGHALPATAATNTNTFAVTPVAATSTEAATLGIDDNANDDDEDTANEFITPPLTPPLSSHSTLTPCTPISNSDSSSLSSSPVINNDTATTMPLGRARRNAIIVIPSHAHPMLSLSSSVSLSSLSIANQTMSTGGGPHGMQHVYQQQAAAPPCAAASSRPAMNTTSSNGSNGRQNRNSSLDIENIPCSGITIMASSAAANDYNDTKTSSSAGPHQYHDNHRYGHHRSHHHIPTAPMMQRNHLHTSTSLTLDTRSDYDDAANEMEFCRSRKQPKFFLFSHQHQMRSRFRLLARTR